MKYGLQIMLQKLAEAIMKKVSSGSRILQLPFQTRVWIWACVWNHAWMEYKIKTRTISTVEDLVPLVKVCGCIIFINAY